MGFFKSKYHFCNGLLKIESTKPRTSGMPTAMYKLTYPGEVGTLMFALTTPVCLLIAAVLGASFSESPPVRKVELELGMVMELRAMARLGGRKTGSLVHALGVDDNASIAMVKRRECGTRRW